LILHKINHFNVNEIFPHPKFSRFENFTQKKNKE